MTNDDPAALRADADYWRESYARLFEAVQGIGLELIERDAALAAERTARVFDAIAAVGMVEVVRAAGAGKRCFSVP